MHPILKDKNYIISTWLKICRETYSKFEQSTLFLIQSESPKEFNQVIRQSGVARLIKTATEEYLKKDGYYVMAVSINFYFIEPYIASQNYGKVVKQINT